MKALDELERGLALGFRHDARRADLSEATARLLLALAPGEALPMREVALRMGRDPSTATRFTDRAEREGLVQRAPGLDRRRRLVGLTPEGLAARDRLLRLRRARAERTARRIRDAVGLDAEQVEWFVQTLERAL